MCRLPNEDERAAAHARMFSPALVRAVLRWLAMLGVPRCHRGDVAGQVWVQAWESWPRFDPKRGSPERWLNAITVHVASHYYERAHHRREVLVDLLDMTDVLDPAPDAAAVLELDEARAGIIRAVSELDPDLQFVVVAHYLNGISMVQLAEDANMPVATLYRRHAKAIGALRDLFYRRETGESPTTVAQR
ncbi:sigma-70 family RNA polymerase sigma factor [Sorangium sp. So ce861]|uniref:sigma-70 family RNA polymerase sigma factor n=1 Tax=Sorangium sp. So ce861 TaxID=3133323 RepID=UPI003F5E7ED6